MFLARDKFVIRVFCCDYEIYLTQVKVIQLRLRLRWITFTFVKYIS